MKRKRPSNDPSVEHEPQHQDGPFEGDPSEARAARNADQGTESDDDRVEHSVWDEPGLSEELSGAAPPDALTWSGWLEEKLAKSNAWSSWGITFAAAAVAGPMAVAGTFCSTFSGSTTTWFGILTLIVFGPVLEEMMKVALPLWIVEKRPYLFRSRFQIALCTIAAALVFAAIENVLYLGVYIRDPTETLVVWRWTVCVALHAGCSLVAGLGLMRIWSGIFVGHRTWPAVSSESPASRPNLALGAPYIMTAVVIHGTYNALTVVLGALDFRF